MFPEESANACETLGAQLAMPIHWGVYSLSTHGWDDPPTRFVKAAEELDIAAVTPMLGETMNIDEPESYKEKWWENKGSARIEVFTRIIEENPFEKGLFLKLLS